MSTENKENFFSRFGESLSKFFKEVKSEIKKIIWPTKKQMIMNTSIVVVSIVVIGLFVTGIDAAYAYLFNLIIR